ncbi:hypothetical protein GH714_027420 [Hevea brasiliensis]|uniref:Calponin-homology (CH) domain-containing protein n=1 Tax=Hevea brasiliensis TaxID=3981 RepID=A0A6A6K887_HEVBR|nr:hypothetical protein GH714_027420 [Hevea brasiliensis]
MSGYVGILVSDPSLQNQFTQVELRSLKSHFMSMRRESGKLTLRDLASRMSSKLINVAVPGTIDERAINTKRVLNPWERNENHTLCLNSAKAIGCTVVNIGTQDFIEGRRHLVLGLISQIIKIQLLADLNLKKTPQLVELVDDSKDVEELMSLPPEKILLRWMNFQLKKAGYKKIVTNFSSDVKDAEAYAHLLNVLAPEYSNPSTLTMKSHLERAKLVLEHADRMGCKRYLTAKDIVEGSPNLNLAFVAHIFQHRWVLLETLDKLMRYNILQLLKNLRFHSHGKEITDADILKWANTKVRDAGSQSSMDSFKDKSLSDGIFFLDLLSAVQPRAVNWSLVTKGVTDEEKKMNATYIISIARKLGCSIFLLPEDITEVNQKMILTLTASIKYWFLKQPVEEKPNGTSDSETTISISTVDDSASESSLEESGNL